ncbi:hypothetical protein [Fluviicola sp.]|jgi:hypothetical protein|uniref:hypothetical protein n=1 Tax=Fluviicola sp. TaxID=1917219 RepID=UPI002832158F|nr:hypothetical protein [Fluviicola sp.]MDR0801599.1 hypothetical protein [Fluviicola sp.]
MRVFVLIIGFCCSFSAALLGQEVRMTDESVSFSVGVKNAIVANIPFAKKAVVEKQLKSELKSWKGKMVVLGDEYQILQGKNKIFGESHVNVYAKIIETVDDIKVAFVVDKGGRFMTSEEDPAEYKATWEKVKKFGATSAAASINVDVNADKKVLKSMEKDEKKIKKSIESSKKSIENYQKKIDQSQKDIEAKQTELSNKQEEIKAQNQQISDRKKTAKKIQ